MVKKKSTQKKEKRLLMLLDGNAIIHRAFHGVPPLTTNDGTQVGAVYGFTATLLNVLEKYQPTHVIASFDLPGKTFRHEMFSDYKKTRKPTDPDLVPQFDLTKEVVRAFTIPIMERESVEADDVIGTLAAQGEDADVDVVIVTGDKDLLQLVTERVSVVTMSRGVGETVLYDSSEKVIEKMGVGPEKIVDYKGLCGDPSDNIPGVKGVGPKTAVKLLTEHGDLDGVYKNVSETKGALNKKLTENEETAFLSRELGRVKTDVDVTLDLGDADAQTIDWGGARQVFHKFSFNSLIKRLGERGSEADLSDNPADSQAGTAVKDVQVITGKDAKDFFENLDVSEVVSVVVDGNKEKLHGLGLHTSKGPAFLVFDQDSHESIANFLLSMQNRLRFFDAKAALHVLAAHDLEVGGIAEDVLLKAYVARSGQKLEFDDLVFEVTGRMVETKDAKNQMALDLRNEEEEQKKVAQAAADVSALNAFFDKEIAAIVKDQSGNTIENILTELEMPLIRVLFDMERAGVLLDKKVFKKISDDMAREITQLEKGIYKDAGSEFNINSPKQLQVVLFEDLQIDTSNIKKTKTGFSTASSELEKMRDGNPIIEKIERYRELFKLKSTYTDVLPEMTDAEDRLHTTYNQTITPTGRLSSIDPNLQNIPIRTEAGRKLRDGFVAPTGKKLVAADYSQIELRCVAHVADDEKMIAAFKGGADIHTYTAATVLGKKEKDIDYDERRSAKELNFGLIYGMGAFSFARSAGISMDEANIFIDTYFKQFAGVKKYMDEIKASGAEHGYVETEGGRRKWTPELQSRNFQLRAAGERAAINMPIQGLAAEIMKRAMIAVDDYLKENHEPDEAQMILQIHDEVILEVADEHVQTVRKDIGEIMESVYELKVPLVIDTSAGQNWGEL